jgi:hypothetical protein
LLVRRLKTRQGNLNKMWNQINFFFLLGNVYKIFFRLVHISHVCCLSCLLWTRFFVIVSFLWFSLFFFFYQSFLDQWCSSPEKLQANFSTVFLSIN